MQGVLDPLVRHLLTAVNDYDLCITEFVRVVDMLLPEKLFSVSVRSWKRRSDRIRYAGADQLLGQFPQWLAENAARAAELGSQGWISTAAARPKQ